MRERIPRKTELIDMSLEVIKTVRKRPLEFEVGDHVFLKVSPLK